MDAAPDTHPTLAPSEDECLRQSEDYFYGLNGGDIDYEKHAEWMQRGHELGYLNCTEELCDCYAEGYGVPRDPARALELARELEAKGCPLGWKHLARAYAEGRGVPLDREKARGYARQLLQALARPVKGVDEELRREALLVTYHLLDSLAGKMGIYTEGYMRVARENMLESHLPVRYALYATALMQQLAEREEEDGEEAEAATREISAYLDKGIALGDELACYLQSVVVSMLGEPQEKVTELLWAAAPARQEVVWGDLLYLGGLDGEKLVEVREAYWYSCNLGVSLMNREDALPCHIRLLHSPFAGDWVVHADSARDFTPIEPRIALYNTGEETLSGLTLRLCSADAGVDFRCALEGSIEPRDVMELPLDAYEQKAGKPFGSGFYVEVESGGRRAEMELEHTMGLTFFRRPAGEADMDGLELWWERSLLGGLVLCARSAADLHDFTLARRRDGRVTPGRTLRAGEVVRFGRREFRSLRGLTLGDELGLYCQELPMVAVTLAE